MAAAYGGSPAVMVIRWHRGTVLAGRSLRLVKDREPEVEVLSGGVWLITLAAGAVAALVAARLWQSSPTRDGETTVPG